MLQLSHRSPESLDRPDYPYSGNIRTLKADVMEFRLLGSGSKDPGTRICRRWGITPTFRAKRLMSSLHYYFIADSLTN